jgi:hypothetical protein
MQLSWKTIRRQHRQHRAEQRRIAEYMRMKPYRTPNPGPPEVQIEEKLIAANRLWLLHRLRLAAQILCGKLQKQFSPNRYWARKYFERSNNVPA